MYKEYLSFSSKEMPFNPPFVPSIVSQRPRFGTAPLSETVQEYSIFSSIPDAFVCCIRNFANSTTERIQCQVKYLYKIKQYKQLFLHFFSPFTNMPTCIPCCSCGPFLVGQINRKGGPPLQGGLNEYAASKLIDDRVDDGKAEPVPH